MTPKIKLIITTYTSERDTYGNCYHAAVAVSTVTGERMAWSGIGGESNMTGFARSAGFEWDDLYYTQVVLPKRQWKAFTSGWPYGEREQIENELKRLGGLPYQQTVLNTR